MSRFAAYAWIAFTIAACGLCVGWLLGADYHELYLKTLAPKESVECWLVERTLLQRVELVIVPGLDDEVPLPGSMFHTYDLWECDTGVEYYVRVR